ncbi:MAG: RNA polymerase subunit sigma-70 [Candidatus Methylomirabilota bacterium]|nr:MAG: RNA polymerase subunit sigma-70 [candidate division NC10 bacterium]
MQMLSKNDISELFLAHQELLCSYLRRRLSSEIDARDLAQEAYLRLLSVSDRGLVVKNPRAYLYTIATNLVHERCHGELPAGRRVSDNVMLELESSEPSPEEKAERQIQLELVDRVLLELSPKCRAVVTMRTRQGMTYREIAELLGISTNMVKRYLSLAVARCRKQLRRYRD